MPRYEDRGQVEPSKSVPIPVMPPGSKPEAHPYRKRAGIVERIARELDVSRMSEVNAKKISKIEEIMTNYKNSDRTFPHSTLAKISRVLEGKNNE
jgi:hypothetical protein